jgi:hypothetical protein
LEGGSADTTEKALAHLLRAIDPEIEIVNDQNGRKLA